MPIYAYRCSSCGHAQDLLQKISDPVLTTCPACGAEAFTKQVTAAGFQLKGSGWYVTDFRGGSGAAKKDAEKGADKGADQAGASGTADKPAADKPAVPAATAAQAAPPAAAPAAGD
ncbi:MAG: zinc ribbon domain-containing protein [Rubrivivax sp.]|nr:zinc ribbon domain-containing protein [Rubrivivax sp.]